LLFDRRPPYSHELAQAKIAATGDIKAYNLIGYDAVGVGGFDLAGGLDFLQELAQQSTFTWLSANLVERASGKPLFAPFITRNLGGARVAIIGLTASTIAEEGLLDQRALLKDWSAVLPALLPQLSGDHDFIVLLTDLPPTVCGAIARRFPTINLIVAATGEILNQEPRLLTPTTLFTATGKQGRYVGALAINWSPGHSWGEGQNHYLRLKNQEEELTRTTAQIEELRDKPELASQLGNLERRRNVLLEALDELRQSRAADPHSYFANSFQAMDKRVGEDPQVAAVNLETRATISELGRKMMAEARGGEPLRLPGFTGWRTCENCHPQVTAKWRETGHAEAYTTLVVKNRQFNGDCLPCHVTGSEYSDPAQLVSLAPELTGVGCEACHGPGQAHVDGQGRPMLREITANLCQGCHLPEHDGDFDFSRKVAKIRCNR